MLEIVRAHTVPEASSEIPQDSAGCLLLLSVAALWGETAIRAMVKTPHIKKAFQPCNKDLI